MESIIIRTTYDAKCLYSPNVREQLGTMARTGMILNRREREGGPRKEQSYAIMSCLSLHGNHDGDLTEF